MQQHTKAWRAVMITGMVAAGVGLRVLPAVAKLLAPVQVTGQTQCWDVDGLPMACDKTGQDGDSQAGVPFPIPRFTDNLDGTVRDNLTGLTWLKDAGCIAHFTAELGTDNGDTWGEALRHIDDLNARRDFSCEGYAPGTGKNWRLPNIKELQSLVDLGVDLVDPEDGRRIPALPDAHPFLNVGRPAYFYWSSTTQLDEPHKAWGVDLDEGKTLPHFKDDPICGTSVRASFNVWPVRGPDGGSRFAPVPVTGQTQCWDPADGTCPIAEIKCGKKKAKGQDGAIQAGERSPTRRFHDLGDGTVRDSLTTLIWLKDMGCLGAQEWAGALAKIGDLNAGSGFGCAGYTFVRFDDWRLPNVKELQSLVDFGHVRDPALPHDPALPAGHPFVNVRAAAYHSSTTRLWLPDDVWFVSLFRGGMTLADPAEASPPGEGCTISGFDGSCATKYESRRVWAVRGGRLRSASTP